MSNTYTQFYMQFVFAVRNCASLIHPAWESRLHQYITAFVQQNGHKLIAINGMPDHLHCFISYNEKQLVPDLMQRVKVESSEWINKQRLVDGKFSWQEGYGGFAIAEVILIRFTNT